MHNPTPADHHMTDARHHGAGHEPVHFIKDYVGLDYHNDGHTHIDALCHVAYEGWLYNGRSEAAVTRHGASVDAIETLKDGLVGRGCCSTCRRSAGSTGSSPASTSSARTSSGPSDATACRCKQGDILWCAPAMSAGWPSVGRGTRPSTRPGCTLRRWSSWAERGVAALGSDGNNDTAPSSTEGVGFPIHVLAIAAMGIHLLDYLQLEDLREACERTGRWEFMFTAAPLRIVGGTGSPLNPVAVL